MSKIDIGALEKDIDSLPLKGGGRSVCALKSLVAKYPEAEEVLRKAIAAEQYSPERISQVLTKNGLKIGESSVKRHRDGRCTVCQGAKV